MRRKNGYDQRLGKVLRIYDFANLRSYDFQPRERKLNMYKEHNSARRPVGPIEVAHVSKRPSVRIDTMRRNYA